MRNKKKIGFTLLEMIAVVMIIGILATLAIPRYTTIQERAHGSEAIANLKMIGAAERMYRMEITPTAFVACNCNTAAVCNAAGGCNFLLKLSLNTDHWTYAVANVTLGPPPTFTATATRASTGCIYTFTQANSEPTKNGSCPP